MTRRGKLLGYYFNVSRLSRFIFCFLKLSHSLTLHSPLSQLSLQKPVVHTHRYLAIFSFSNISMKKHQGFVQLSVVKFKIYMILLKKIEIHLLPESINWVLLLCILFFRFNQRWCYLGMCCSCSDGTHPINCAIMWPGKTLRPIFVYPFHQLWLKLALFLAQNLGTVP